MTSPGKPERRLSTAVMLLGLAAVVFLAGCSRKGGGDQGGSAGTPAATGTTTAPTSSPSTTPSGAPTAQPGASATTTPTSSASSGPEIKGPPYAPLQDQLSALGYWLGKPDGHFGDLTQQAVYALQKAAGLPRDGVVGAKTRAALAAGKRPTITTTGSGHRIEINKKTQLLLIIDGSKITTILNTSTGSGRTFVEKGNTEVAVTPSGSFHIQRVIDGNRIGPLGALWRPRYFNGGIAIHGIASVPPYPASHGCARLSFGAINWIWSTNQAPIGMSVKVV